MTECDILKKINNNALKILFVAYLIGHNSALKNSQTLSLSDTIKHCLHTRYVGTLNWAYACYFGVIGDSLV